MAGTKETFVVYGEHREKRSLNHAMTHDGLPACGARIKSLTTGRGNVGCERCLKFLEELEKYKFLKEE